MNPKDLVGAKKAPLKLVPQAAVIGMADGLSVGAKKYGPFNWRLQPIEFMTYIEGAYRHLAALVDGQDFSEDSEAVVGHPVHHLDHVLAGLGILRDAIASGQVVDNRPPKGPAAELLRSMDRSVFPASPSGDRPIHDGPCAHGVPCDPASFTGTPMHEIVSEDWGAGDGPIHVFAGIDHAGEAGDHTVWIGEFEQGQADRKNQPLQLLHACCGKQSHDLDCPRFR